MPPSEQTEVPQWSCRVALLARAVTRQRPLVLPTHDTRRHVALRLSRVGLEEARVGSLGLGRAGRTARSGAGGLELPVVALAMDYYRNP